MSRPYDYYEQDSKGRWRGGHDPSASDYVLMLIFFIVLIVIIAIAFKFCDGSEQQNPTRPSVPAEIANDIGYAWLDELEPINSDSLYAQSHGYDAVSNIGSELTHCLRTGTMFSGGSGEGWIEYDLNGKFARLTGCMAIIQEYYDTTYIGNLVIYADGNEIYRINEMKSGDAPISFDINISGAKLIRIEHKGGDPFRLANMLIWAATAQSAYLANLYVTDSDQLDDNIVHEGTVADAFGNQYYGPYFELSSYSDPGNFFSHGVTYAGYTDLLTNRKYTHFSGAYFLDAEQSDYIGSFRIYADNILVYESGPITEQSGTISFNISINYASTVRVIAYTEDDNPVNVTLVNAVVYNP